MKKISKARLLLDRDTVRVLAGDVLQRLRAGMDESQTLSQTTNPCPAGTGNSDCHCVC